MKIIKSYLTVLSVSFLFLCSIFAQNEVPEVVNSALDIVEVPICPDIEFDMVWQDEVKSQQLYEYSLVTQDYSEYSSGLVANHVLLRWDDQVEQFNEENFTYEFAFSWDYVLQTQITLPENCIYTVEKSITSYDEILLYVGKWSEVLNLTNNQGSWDFNLLIKQVSTENANSPDQLFTDFSPYISHFRYADRMIVDTSSEWVVFDTLGKVFTLNDIDPTSMDTYVISDSNQSYFRRLLARYITAAGLQKVYVTQDQYFGSLFTSLVVWENPKEYDFITPYSVDLEESNKLTLLSYMTDYLLINGFPLGILTLVLILPFVGLLISIARQVVGLSVFGVFTPLLFGISMFVIGLAPSFLLLIAAALAAILVNLLSKKIYLLYSPKISLMLIIYCILTICIRRWHNFFDLWLIQSEAYANSFAIFPFVAILLVAKWVFSDSFLQFKKWWWVTLIEFFAISLGVLMILNSTYLQNIFLGNPELILLVLVLNILVGRFTGLQMLEYIRFFPLIKNYFEEE